MSHAPTSVLHVEGIPGSGKTTTAERLCEELVGRGVDAFWALEESADHPVMPKARRRRAREAGFPRLCLDAWRDFVGRNERLAVLEGYAFQSTVRFMYANEISQTAIASYFDAWQSIGNSSLVYLYVDAVVGHFETVRLERGDDWMSKLTSYVAGTPIAKRHGWSGMAGFVEFWSRYQDLCAELVSTANLPTMMMAARAFDHSALTTTADRLAAGESVAAY